VRNCIVHGFTNTVRVTRQGFKDLAAGVEYQNAFSNIVIENSRLSDSKGSGVFVDGYVTGVTLRDLEISNAGSVGVYLEAGSKDNIVRHCDIHDNGFGDVVPEGVLVAPYRYQSTGREGIAIDGSRNNRVEYNTLTNNSAGGIFLYKNCGEFFTTKPAAWWTRRYGADGNLIRHNTITNARNGIWIGSRMAENLLFMDCSDTPYPNASNVPYYEDFAGDNRIRRNTFDTVRYGIRIEDDGNRVERNSFASSDATHQAILLGTKERSAALGRPVTGVVIRGNRASITGNATPYVWIHPHSDTVFRQNRTGTVRASLAPGVQPPIDPFIFVRQIWLDGEPPPPFLP
jgi:parallel beta-helix repeat protein